MTTLNQNFSSYAGDAVQVQFTVVDGSNTPIDISGSLEIVWQAGRDYKSSPAIVKKKSLGQIAVGGGTGVFTVTINNGDTGGFTGFYAHSAIITDPAGNISTVELGRWQVGPQVPAWTYSGDPSSSDRDAVRNWINDTDSTNQQIMDAEIDYFLTQYPNPLSAAAACARKLAAKYAIKVNKRVGDFSISYSDIAKSYRDLAAELQAQGDTFGLAPYSGGISRNDKINVISNTDRMRPPFREKQFDDRSGPNNTTGLDDGFTEPFGDGS